MDSPLLRTGDRSNVRFKFMYNPEYISVGSTLLFREGRTKGMGKITKLLYPEDKTKAATKGRVGDKAPTPSKVRAVAGSGERKVREASPGSKSPIKTQQGLSPKAGRLRKARQQQQQQQQQQASR